MGTFVLSGQQVIQPDRKRLHFLPLRAGIPPLHREVLCHHKVFQRDLSGQPLQQQAECLRKPSGSP